MGNEGTRLGLTRRLSDPADWDARKGQGALTSESMIA